MGGVGKNVTEIALKLSVRGDRGRLGGIDYDINRCGRLDGAGDGAQPSLDEVPGGGFFCHD